MKNFILAIILLSFTLNCKAAEPVLQSSSAAQTPKAAEELPLIYQPYQPAKNEVIFSQTKIKINAADPTPSTNKAGSYLPGTRGPGQLVIYTPNYGFRTNTNEYGAEATVEGNTVTELSGADSPIPPNGIVISGHGKAKNWINSTINIGTKIYIDSNDVLYAYTTSESYIFESIKKISETEQMIEFYCANNPDYNRKVPNSYINDAKEYMKKAAKDPEQVQKYSRLAIEAANDALKSVVPYKNNELRGIWVRPSEKTAEDIIKSIELIQSAGIDNIFLETYYHGKTIFPSKTMEAYGFVPQYEQFDGIDPLKIWIDEAHKRKMKVHIWFETFYVGNSVSQDNPQSIIAKNPSWGNKTKKDYLSNSATKSASEHNGYFLDPANPFVQDFLMKLLEEIVTCYKPDGLNLDYIRYPNAITLNESSSWGYTYHARKEFKEAYNVDPVDLKISDPLWMDWMKYRSGKVTDFVKKAGEYGKQQQIYTSAVIFPDRLAALNVKQQDWKNWSDNNYIQGFTPLFLTCDSKMASSMMQTVINAKSSDTDFFAGLFVTFMNGSPEDLIRQIHEARKLNASGVIIFDYAHLAPKYTTALATSVFSAKTAQKVTPPQTTPKVKKKWRQFFKFINQ
ncbi:MAG: family 10 glycosylhydrolase [Heliobacteriaceae bacterium]|jgi:uncharacterized lipoprotein YddW (UPF0748 family)|nr:family 10 glycosylhydrolase [Heliobacteriaceae bacterium]